jgi:hypothetical protein
MPPTSNLDLPSSRKMSPSLIVTTLEEGLELFEGFNDGEKFLFDGRIFALGNIKFAGKKSDGDIVLLDGSSKLEIGGIQIHI